MSMFLAIWRPMWRLHQALFENAPGNQGLFDYRTTPCVHETLVTFWTKISGAGCVPEPINTFTSKDRGCYCETKDIREIDAHKCACCSDHRFGSWDNPCPILKVRPRVSTVGTSVRTIMYGLSDWTNKVTVNARLHMKICVSHVKIICQLLVLLKLHLIIKWLIHLTLSIILRKVVFRKKSHCKRLKLF